MNAKKKRGGRSGGPAAAGGMNFQAAVTAIAGAHIARGRPLDWLKDLIDDTPVSLSAETRGPGDDLRIVLRGGERIEAQAKKGLRAGAELWGALLNLALGIHKGEIAFGLLAVCADCSAAVSIGLAEDIIRLGQGRTDGLSKHGKTFRDKLESAQIPREIVCSRLRIKRIHALHHDDADIRAARAELDHLMGKSEDAHRAWDVLYKDASRLIEQRGSRDASSILVLLQSARIAVIARNTNAPTGLLARLTDWTRATTATISVIGAPRPIPIAEGWIDLKANRLEDFSFREGSLKEALKHYHAVRTRTQGNAKDIDAETLARFRNFAVLVAGPGMGKSTMLKRLAWEYATDGLPVLRCDLKSVATLMKEKGLGFSAAAFEIGLDGSSVSAEQMRQAGIGNWVLLCDGLDETGPYQELVAEGAAKFAAAHPNTRMVVSTRPIGYSTAQLSSWQHYELIHLEASSTSAYVARMLEHLLPTGEAASASELASKALARSEIKELLARSPLLVSLSASLLARGVRLGETKIELYAAIMKLLEAAPAVRTASLPSPSTSVAQRYLQIVGWFIQDRPLTRLEDIHAHCSRKLAEFLQCTPLSAGVHVDQCFAYWEALGIIERVHHGADEAVTFVHKTFGEFAAAKYLLLLDDEDRRTAIAERVGTDAWLEVLNFAASLGAATEIAERTLARAETQDEEVAAVIRVLELMVDGDDCPNPKIREGVVDQAVRLVQSDRRVLAARVGRALAEAAKKFPGEIAPRVAGLQRHEQSWTRLTAWACLLCGEEGPDLAELKVAIAELPKTASSSRASILGGISLEDSLTRLAEQFLLRAVAIILEKLPEEADAIIPPALDNAHLGTIRYLIAMESIIVAHGKSYKIGPRSEAFSRALSWPGLEDWAESQITFCRAVYGPLAGSSCQPPEATVAGRPLFHLGAFVTFTGFWERTVSDGAPLQEPATVEAVMRATAIASGIPGEQLAADVSTFFARVANAPKADLLAVLQALPSVDPPFEDWSRLLNSGVDVAALERALHHTSEYVVSLAVNCLAALLAEDALRDLLTRTLDRGTGLALAAAACLMQKMKAHDALELLLLRLAKPLNSGSWHLFQQLEMLAPALDDQLMAALRQGLYVGPRTAKATACVAALHSTSNVVALKELLGHAYGFWQKNEKPMPESAGAIPDSPRAEILKALLPMQRSDVASLLLPSSDPRHDVAEVGRKALLMLLKGSEGARLEFVELAVAKSVPPALLRTVLEERVQFSPNAVTHLAVLLEDGEPKYRYAALSLLDTTYMPQDELVSRAKRMTSDAEHDVREAAFRKLQRAQRS